MVQITTSVLLIDRQDPYEGCKVRSLRLLRKVPALANVSYPSASLAQAQ